MTRMIAPNCVPISPQLVSKFGLAGAWILQQIHYNLEEETIGEKDKEGRRWYRKSTREWELEMSFTCGRTVKRAIAAMRDEGVLLSRVDGSNRNWFSIDRDKLSLIFEEKMVTKCPGPGDILSSKGDKMSQPPSSRLPSRLLQDNTSVPAPAKDGVGAEIEVNLPELNQDAEKSPQAGQGEVSRKNVTPDMDRALDGLAGFLALSHSKASEFDLSRIPEDKRPFAEAYIRELGGRYTKSAHSQWMAALTEVLETGCTLGEYIEACRIHNKAELGHKTPKSPLHALSSVKKKAPPTGEAEQIPTNDLFARGFDTSDVNWYLKARVWLTSEQVQQWLITRVRPTREGK